jgi:(1->4)-alpha-D-glucan 1-alpha-D-glucosylmutase
LYAQGPLAGRVVAFQRGESVVTIVPRLVMTAAGRWSGTIVRIAAGIWNNVITGERVNEGDIDLEDLWHDFPVALLERIDFRGTA